MSHTFSTLVELNGKTATGFRVPAEVVEALGQGRRPKVRVTIGPYTYRSTVAVYSGEFMLPLSAANREAAGVAAGETVEVTLEADLAERTVEMPDDLASALAERTGARAAFDKLSFTAQRERTEAVTSAKRAETRERRIAKIVAELAGDGLP
ncbi:YdeI/OmpD-associated family protein [Amycolatopsis sp. FU40]|uniref:YdeI/OmpD-associated family protein n=1 Tax=Amycolatopsis sp. FU40 TaxID=2914159 RepID=UPI001F2CAB28|nr:YdeI/OmpD-associated family protein [Amycolatopsis sp. FU40]UKD55589.1 YdeI/OmpD-associated family protein [Amycolatopsis sp. FU40]